MAETTARIEISGTSRIPPVSVFAELVSTSAPSSPLGRFYKAQFELDTNAEGRKRGEGWHFLAVPNAEFRSHTYREVVEKAARWLHEQRPDRTPQIAARIKITRRFIAPSRRELCPCSVDGRLSAYEFAPGWFVDTQHGRRSVKGFLRGLFRLYGYRAADWHYERLRRT